MTLEDAMQTACEAVGINPPKRRPVPGRWTRTDTFERNGKGDAEVMINGDGRGVSVVNWQTGQRKTVRVDGTTTGIAPVRRDPQEARREIEEREAVAAVCERIVKTCRQDVHPYLAAKGFPDEIGLVHDNPRECLPAGSLGDAIARAMPDGPLLIVPGRIGQRVTTVQFIAADGAKKNILRGAMSGACHRIASGRRTVVCEGIATALSVRAACRMLNAQVTILSAFSAANVAKVAAAIPGAFIAADHDKPVEALHGKGTGEFYAAGSGCQWAMPPSRGDFNDMHQSEGLRAVAMHLREALMG